MRTKEFIKNVEKLGFTAEKDNSCIFVKDSQRAIVAKIRHDEEKSISTDYLPFYFLSTWLKKRLFDLFVEYANTPVEYKEEPERYYLRLKGAKHIEVPDRIFLNRHNNHTPQKYNIGGWRECKSLKIQTEFTQEEIDELPKELLEAFDQIEVEDEE